MTKARCGSYLNPPRARWEIELLFLTLKEGHRVEALRQGTVQRIERALAIYLMVA